MNELKPEDVMMELEHCFNGGSCRECRLYGTANHMTSCMAELMKDALALLREKDAEIERLTKELADVSRDCAVAEQNHYECKKELETTRAEAITEFADRLIKKCDAPHWCVWMSEIEDLEQEMKGETE